MKTALFAGSFDPMTLGHLDIIERTAKLCGKVYVGLADNVTKASPVFPLTKREEMVKLATKKLPHVEVIPIEGLLVAFAKKHKVDLLVRSLRPGADMSHEFAMATANKQMSGIDTIFLVADPAVAFISSTLVREIYLAGGNLQGFIPPELLPFFKA